MDIDVQKTVWLLALINGVGVYESAIEYNNIATFTRDDIYKYLVEDCGVEEGEAFKLMEDIRKGKGSTAEVQDKLKAFGLSERFREMIKPIEFMSLEGTCYVEAYVVFFIAANSYDTGDCTRV